MISTFQWTLTVLLSILFTYLFVQPSVQGPDRTNPRKKQYDTIYPDLPDLQSLTGLTRLPCSYPDPDPLKVSCGKTVEKSQKKYALSILRAINAKSPDTGAPTEMLSELAECHFCAKHRKQASNQLKKALCTHWCATWANCKPTTNAGFKEGHDLLHQGTAATHPASAPDFVIPSPTYRNKSLQGSIPRSAPLSPPVTPTRVGQSRRPSKELRGNAALPHPREHRTSRLPASPEFKDPDDLSGIQDSGMWVVTPIPPESPHQLHDKVIKTLTLTEKTRGYVYILQKPGCNEYYKIGFTADSPEERLKKHRNACGVKWIRVFSNKSDVLNAKRVELLIHQDLQMRGCRVHAPCWTNVGSTCEANHSEVFRGNLDELIQIVEFWCNWMTYYDPYDNCGQIKPLYIQYTIEVNLEAKSNLLQRKFCSRSYGELWVCRGARRASAVDRRTLQTSPPAAVPGRIPTSSPSAALADSPSLNTRSRQQQDRRRSAPAVSTPVRGGNNDLLRPHLPPSASDSLLGSPTLRQSPRLSQAFGSPESPRPLLSPGLSESTNPSLEDLQGSQNAQYLTLDGEDPLELWECERCFRLNGGAVADCEVCASREIFDRKEYIGRSIST